MSTQQPPQQHPEEGEEADTNPASSTSPPPYIITTTADASEPQGLLEPSLKLDISTIQNNLYKSDQAFAREVVKLIAERAENGIFARDCWGYKFLDPPVALLIVGWCW